MASFRSTTPSVTSTNLWDRAVEKLNEEDKRNVNFERQDKRAILVALSEEVQRKKELCISQRLKYRRKNGERVVLYDVYEKMVKWIDTFKQIGDVALQYDPGYAALPWAGVRFFLQVRWEEISGLCWLWAESLSLYLGRHQRRTNIRSVGRRLAGRFGDNLPLRCPRKPLSSTILVCE